MRRILTIEEVRQRCKDKHNNKFTYCFEGYTRVKDKIRITCPKHGEFYQEARSHYLGTGCPKCSGVGRLSTSEFIERARTVHSNKYQYPNTIYISTDAKVNIKCSLHGDFAQTPHDHLSGKGCAICGGNSQYLEKDYFQAVTIIHNGRYTYSPIGNTVVPLSTVLQIRCKLHGIFEQTANHHLKGAGCQTCADIKRRKKYLDVPTTLYYVYFPDTGAYKLGITIKTISKRFAGTNIPKYSIIKTWDFPEGKLAYSIEQKCLKATEALLYNKVPILPAGNTEVRSEDIMSTILPIINKYLKEEHG